RRAGQWTASGGRGAPAVLEIARVGAPVVVVLDPSDGGVSLCPDVLELSVRSALRVDGLLDAPAEERRLTLDDEAALQVDGSSTWEALQARGDTIAPVDLDPAAWEQVTLGWTVWGLAQGAWQGTLQWSASREGEDTVAPDGLLTFP
ncbi:MAG TPA: hypothetical protein PKA64_20285, partial [Myxococcota bacterium]|nr:hypothetical protein [Myxococcota bacterium]